MSSSVLLKSGMDEQTKIVKILVATSVREQRIDALPIVTLGCNVEVVEGRKINRMERK